MSSKHRRHFSDGRSTIYEVPTYGITAAAGVTVPSDGAAGYAPGCTFQDLNAAAGSQFYINEGTKASADFNAVKLAGVDLSTLTATAAELNTLSGILATGAELNRAADVSTRIVNVAATPLAVTVAAHDGKIIELDLASGIAVTLPSLAAANGAVFRFKVKTTFVGAASIKSVASGDIMVGHALMGNDSNNGVVDWQSLASDTNDTIDLFGTANSTGGLEGQEIEIVGGTGRWYVSIRGDAAGTEATPFANTV